jgi:hypothetical protein
MADTKISALPASTTPLAGTEVLPIVQGGATVKVSAANLTAGRVISANGVAFPATASASSDPNTLDDYEEGSFTPTVIGTTTAGTASYAAQKGIYTKIGNVVYFSIALNWNSGTGTGNLRMSGLPFTTRNDSTLFNSVAIGVQSDLTLPVGTYLSAITLPNTSTIAFFAAVVGPGGTTTAVAYDASAEIECSGFYFI